MWLSFLSHGIMSPFHFLFKMFYIFHMGPPNAYHGLCSYTDCIERGGRVNPPHIHLIPGRPFTWSVLWMGRHGEKKTKKKKKGKKRKKKERRKKKREKKKELKKRKKKKMFYIFHTKITIIKTIIDHIIYFHGIPINKQSHSMHTGGKKHKNTEFIT